MNKMNQVDIPAARTEKDIRREMLDTNRFMGKHQAWWGLVLTPVALFLFELMDAGAWSWWLPLVAYLMAWGSVELCFLPRRLAIIRLAAMESRAEVVRLAWLHGVALRDVMARRHRPGL